MKRLKVDSALVVISRSIDEYPIWSSNSQYLGFNDMGKWYKINLNKIKLSDATWHEYGKIGTVINENSIKTQLSGKDVENFKKATKFHSPRSITSKHGTKIELKEDNTSIHLIMTRNNESTKTIWTSEMENYHSLSLSPDDKFVAYISELNGIIVMKVD